MKTAEAGLLRDSSRHPGVAVARASTAPREKNDPRSWRVPSGRALGEFALRAGFLVGRLLKPKDRSRS
jgi:hypothetical protein